ncbi:conserved membrane hypothetical protein [Azospirillaceae bacterium]
MIRPLYDWTMRLAAGRHALPALAAVSFIESSFFPIPPDVLLIPIILANRRKAFWIAFLCTVASVIGGYFGYAIGYFLFQTIGRQIFEFYHIMDKYTTLAKGFEEWGVWIIIVKGMTPIPYKLLTIASGAFHFNILLFSVASLISRSLRFFLVATLLWKFGEPIREFIERRLTLVTTLFAVSVIGGVLLLMAI